MGQSRSGFPGQLASEMTHGVRLAAKRGRRIWPRRRRGHGRNNERGTGVHADGHAERFCDFFPSRARLEGGIRVKHDAAIATRGDRDGQRDKLARLLAELAGFRVGCAESLIPLDRVRRQLREIADAGADFLVVLIPIHDHGFSALARISILWAAH